MLNLLSLITIFLQEKRTILLNEQFLYICYYIYTIESVSRKRLKQFR